MGIEMNPRTPDMQTERRDDGTSADLVERLNDPHRRLVVSDRQEAAIEIKRLREQFWETARTSHEWMQKHDGLLGFIQKRSAVLKELIAEDAAAKRRREDAEQDADEGMDNGRNTGGKV